MKFILKIFGLAFFLSLLVTQNIFSEDEIENDIFEDEDVEIVDGIDPKALKGVIKSPTVLDVKKEVRTVEDRGVTIYTRELNLDIAGGIDELFRKCREIDNKVKEQNQSGKRKKIEQLFKKNTYLKKYGIKRYRGKYFNVVGPKYEYFKAKKALFSTVLTNMLKAADTAFDNAVDQVLMGQFINWAAVQGTIFVINDSEIWRQLGITKKHGLPVQTVFSNPDTREIFVYAGRGIYDFADQAVAFAVSEMVLDEYAKTITGIPSAQLPLFFRTGLAASAGNLESVITLTKPIQIKEVKTIKGTYKIPRPKKGIKYPLKKNDLLKIDEIIKAKEFPANNNKLFYFLRQSECITETLKDRAPLAAILFAQRLASGKEFIEEIGPSYMDAQRDVEQRKVVRPKKNKDKDKKEKDEKINKFQGYENFKKLMNSEFYKLTQKYRIEEQKKKRKKAIERNAKKKKEEEKKKKVKEEKKKSSDWGKPKTETKTN